MDITTNIIDTHRFRITSLPMVVSDETQSCRPKPRLNFVQLVLLDNTIYLSPLDLNILHSINTSCFSENCHRKVNMHFWICCLAGNILLCFSESLKVLS